MLEETRKAADRRIKEHLSISVSLIVFLILIMSGSLSFVLEVAAGLAMAIGVIYNHLLCRKLRLEPTRGSPG